MNRPLLFGFLAAALLGSSIYTVDAREVAVVTLFGKPVKTVMDLVTIQRATRLTNVRMNL